MTVDAQTLLTRLGLFSALALGCCCCAAHSSSSVQSQGSAYDPDTLAVYRVALQGSHAAQNGKTIVIDETCFDPRSDRYFQTPPSSTDFPGVPDDAVRDFVTKAVVTVRHDRFDGLGIPYTVLSAAEKAHLSHGSNVDFDLFFARYPNAVGLVTMSRVGFSTDHRFALVYVALTNGSLGGFGIICILTKNNGAWQMTGSKVLWVS